MLERIIDMAADELDLDPVEIRRRNLLPPERFPLTTGHRGELRRGRVREGARRGAPRRGLTTSCRRDQAARRDRGDTKQLGIGVATYVEVTAGGLFQEFGSVEVHPDGTVTATVGTSSHGQGHETSFSMIVAELLEVPMESVRLVQSDTAIVPRGSGTMGSRSLQIAGSALFEASEGVIAKAKLLAAHLLEADVADIVLEDGRFSVAGVPAAALSWAELAGAAADDTRRPPEMEPALAVALDFNQGEATYPFGPTSRWWRSTPTPAGRPLCGTSRSTTAGASSTRSSSPVSSTVASRRGSRRRSSRVSPTTPTATRSPRRCSTMRSRARPSSPTSKRRTR